MEESPSYNEEVLLKLIPVANFDELKMLTEAVRKDKHFYTTFSYNQIARAISKRLKELGDPLSK